jgi:hypothetical protein
MNYSWYFQSIEVKKQDGELANIVVRVYWQYTATDDVYRAFKTGNTQLLAPDPQSFVNLNDITNDMLETWVTAAADVEALRAELSEKIEQEKINAVYIIPWSAPPPPPPAPPLSEV